MQRQAFNPRIASLSMHSGSIVRFNFQGIYSQLGVLRDLLQIRGCSILWQSMYDVDECEYHHYCYSKQAFCKCKARGVHTSLFFHLLRGSKTNTHD